MKIYRIMRYAVRYSEEGTYCDYGHDGNCEAWVYNPQIRDDLIKEPQDVERTCGSPLHKSPAAMYNPKAYQRCLQGRIDHSKKVITVVLPRTTRVPLYDEMVPWNKDALQEQLGYIQKLFAMDYPEYKIKYYNS